MRLTSRLAGSGRTRTQRELIGSVVVAVVVLLLVGGLASFAARWVAQHQSLAESERRTDRLAKTLSPSLQKYLTGQPGAEEDMNAEVQIRVNNDDLTEIVVWDPAGIILFSNNPTEIGERAPMGPELLEVLRTGKTVSDFETGEPEADQVEQPDSNGGGDSDQSDATAEGEGGGAVDAAYQEGGANRYVEVYAPRNISDYGPVVVEAYYNYDKVEELTHNLFLLILPVVLVPLLLLQAIQLPIAVSLARRVRRHEKERTALLEEALSVSDRERVRFAADLHDGPIQELAGIGYALGVVSPTVAEPHRPLMGRVEEALQRAILGLRGLMTDLYPPDLRTGTLDHAVELLSAPLRAEGVDVVVTLEPLPRLSEETVGAFYRVTREALTNVAKHARASTVTLTLDRVPGPRGEDHVRLRITDDGVGLDPARTDRRAEGHLGLRLISDRVATLGGTLDIDSDPSRGGTTVTAVLPLVPADEEPVSPAPSR